MHQLNRFIVANVINPVGSSTGSGVWCVATPVRVRCCGLICDPHHTLDDVVDIGKVTAHLAVIEDINRLAGKNSFGKQEQGHVRTAPGTVNGEKTQPGTRQVVQMGIGMRHQLIGFFAGRVKRHRMVDVVMDGKRHACIGPINRRRGGIHQVTHLMVSTAFEDIHETNQVGIDISMRIGQ